MDVIGLVGLGAMGSALLERLHLAEVEVVGYDIDPGCLERARVGGAKPLGSPAEVARAAKTIDVVVRTDDEVLECVLGESGVLGGALPGSLILIHGTILPQTTRRVAEAASLREVGVIDACMMGVPDVVRRGEMRFVVGGPADLVERARPHLLRMGSEVRHVGPLGSGNVAKLIHNLVQGADTLLLHEIGQLADAAGFPYPQAFEFLRETHSASAVNRWQRTFDPSGADPTPQIGHNTIGKDVPLAAELAQVLGIDLPIIEQFGLKGLKLAAAAEAHV